MGEGRDSSSTYYEVIGTEFTLLTQNTWPSIWNNYSQILVSRQGGTVIQERMRYTCIHLPFLPRDALARTAILRHSWDSGRNEEIKMSIQQQVVVKFAGQNNRERGKVHKGRVQEICIGPSFNLLLSIKPQMHSRKLQEINWKKFPGHFKKSNFQN